MIEMKIKIKEEFSDEKMKCCCVDINIQQKKATEGERQVLKEYEKRLKVNEEYQTMSFPPKDIDKKLSEFLEFLEKHKDISLD